MKMQQQQLDVVPAKNAPMQPMRPGESQVSTTRRVMAQSGMNVDALAAIEAGDAAIDRNVRK